MRKIIKWSVIVVLSLLIIWILNSYRKCRRDGKKSGKLFECNPFSSVPEFLNPEEVRHKMKGGKCYEITDYGKKMSYREVGLSNCGESEIKRSSDIEEALYEEDIK